METEWSGTPSRANQNTPRSPHASRDTVQAGSRTARARVARNAQRSGTLSSKHHGPQRKTSSFERHATGRHPYTHTDHDDKHHDQRHHGTHTNNTITQNFKLQNLAANT